MSSEFHHDVEGKTIVEKKGMKFINLHDKIYQLNEGETALTLDAEHHAENAARPIDFSNCAKHGEGSLSKNESS